MPCCEEAQNCGSLKICTMKRKCSTAVWGLQLPEGNTSSNAHCGGCVVGVWSMPSPPAYRGAEAS
eukprot:4522648-Amphidinium_carterae.2